MSDTLARAAWTVFAVAVGGAVVSAGWIPLIGVAVLLGVAAGASKSRRLQERVPLLRTHKQRLAEFYDSCYALRGEFKRQRKESRLEGWDAWAEKVRQWDAPFWAYLQKRRDDTLPLRRTLHSPPAKDFANWDEITMRAINSRLGLIERLLNE